MLSVHTTFKNESDIKNLCSTLNRIEIAPITLYLLLKALQVLKMLSYNSSYKNKTIDFMKNLDEKLHLQKNKFLEMSTSVNYVKLYIQHAIV